MEKKTILVAEDERIIRNLTDVTLKKAGYNVLLAEDGLQAIEIFKDNQENIDLLMLDVMMPNLNGWEAYQTINRINPDVPVIFCSGYSDDILKEEYLHEVPAEIVQKPYRLNVLLERIAQVIKKDSEI
ncbi:MAG: response regulator [Spirochaetaceae bacterium]|jgi:CheY-like chemotaxis protein|nr:response regulator [Spirochaetaceae bacterium]